MRRGRREPETSPSPLKGNTHLDYIDGPGQEVEFFMLNRKVKFRCVWAGDDNQTLLFLPTVSVPFSHLSIHLLGPLLLGGCILAFSETQADAESPAQALLPLGAGRSLSSIKFSLSGVATLSTLPSIETILSCLNFSASFHHRGK